MRKSMISMGLLVLLLFTGCQGNNDEVKKLNKTVEEQAAVIQAHEQKIEQMESLIKELKDTLEEKDQELVELIEKNNELTNDVKISDSSPEQAEKMIKKKTIEVISILKEKDMEGLAEYVHPKKGVRFTPYTTISLETDQVFDKASIEGFMEDQKKYKWGYYDGIGEEILLTPKEYYNQFIYDEDYKNAEVIGFNKVVSPGNNNLENQDEIYPDSFFTEFYFSGFNPEFQGIDWKSLRVIFEQYEGEWYLVGIIHNQWTI